MIENTNQEDSLSVRSVLVAVLLLRILCKISVGTLVYQCVKLLWVFPGVGGLGQRTGAAPDKPSKGPPGGKGGFTAEKKRRSRGQSRIYRGAEQGGEVSRLCSAEQGERGGNDEQNLLQ